MRKRLDFNFLRKKVERLGSQKYAKKQWSNEQNDEFVKVGCCTKPKPKNQQDIFVQ